MTSKNIIIPSLGIGGSDSVLVSLFTDSYFLIDSL